MRINDDRLAQVALVDLERYGWQLKYKRGDIFYLNDGTGSTPACRLVVNNGVASVWSYRGDVTKDLASPWRPGRATADGNRSCYATARDFGLESERASSLPTKRYVPPPDVVDSGLVRQVAMWISAGDPAPADHRHLIKAGVRLRGDGLKLIPDGSGDLFVPLFRPLPDAVIALELCGAQRLKAEPVNGVDKYFERGSKTAGAFALIPPVERLTPDYRINFDAWLNKFRESQSRPLVICEGVSTALAIYETGAGYPIAALSSTNLKKVAEWIKQSGHDRQFPGVVIAADYDVAMRNGRPVSLGLTKAIEAAEKVGAVVAIPDAGSPSGTDARDIYGAAGGDAVVRYIHGAMSPAQARKRPDVARVLHAEVHRGLER